MNLGLGELLLPVLSGYWVIFHCRLFKYWTARQTGYNLFFASAICGMVLLFLANISTPFVDAKCPNVFLFLESYIPFFYSNEIASCIVFAVLFPILINCLITKKRAAKRAARANGDLIECFLQNCIDYADFAEISTRSGKSYIGFIQESGVETISDSDTVIIPLASGYRDNETRNLVLTVGYGEILHRAMKGDFEDLSLRDFGVYLPITEIVSARRFDPEAYEAMTGIKLDEHLASSQPNNDFSQQ